MAIKVLLVGGNGFIGSAIHLSLLKNNLIVFPTSRELTSIKRGFRKLNILDDSTWDFLKTEIKPEIVICTAWETTHNMYWQQKINYEFAEAVKKFSSFCFSIGVHRFIGIGSMSEYGFSPGSCNSLTTQVNPQDPYSETKVLASVNLDNVSKIYGRKANWVRIFHPYGTKENPRRLVPSLLRDMSNRVTVNINYPDHFLDFIHIDDVARAFTEIAIGNYEYSINLGTGVPTSVRNLTHLLCDLLKYPVSRINFNQPIDKKDRLIYVDPNSNIFFNDLKPRIDILTGIKSLIPCNATGINLD